MPIKLKVLIAIAREEYVTTKELHNYFFDNERIDQLYTAVLHLYRYRYIKRRRRAVRYTQARKGWVWEYFLTPKGKWKVEQLKKTSSAY